MKTAVVASVVALLTICPAQAQWITDKSGGEFDGLALYVAATSAGQYGLGLRCKGADTELVFSFPDASLNNSDILNTVNAASPKVRYKVDKGEIKDVPVQIETFKAGAMAIGELTFDQMYDFANSKNNISVVLAVMDKNFYETKFNARGAQAAVTKIISGCGIDK